MSDNEILFAAFDMDFSLRLSNEGDNLSNITLFHMAFLADIWTSVAVHEKSLNNYTLFNNGKQ